MVQWISTENKIRLKSLVVGLVAFALFFLGGYFVLQNKKSEEETSALYTVQSAVRRIRSQVDQYVISSDYLENVIKSGYELDEDGLSTLAGMFPNADGAIRAFELAPGGIITEIYPMQDSIDVFRTDMLTEHAAEARLAKESHEYAMSAPFELKQGGIGALLINPVYIAEDTEQESFWGFVILVIDWDKFVSSIGLERLGDASYCYEIWKEDANTGERFVLARCPHDMPEDRMSVACAIPNDDWHFDIIPFAGWIPASYRMINLFFCYVLAMMISTISYLGFSKRHREQQYAEELKNSAQQAREASEAKTRFLFNMSHDIRTPMNAIMGFSELLERNLDHEERARTYLKKMQNSSNLLLTIINQVLEVARIESGSAALKLEATDLSALFHSVNTVFEADVQKKHLQYEEDVKVSHIYAYCDKTKLEEIFLNIVSNAIKYTPDGHSIRVEIHELPSGDEEKARYRFICEDTGIGMSEDYLPKIFEEFSRERTSTENKVIGTGLGLPIVKALVTQMGGTIDVQSKQGVGTKFTVELSLALASREAVYQPTEVFRQMNLTNVKGRRILLAEDNDLNAEITMELLGEEGILVDRAVDGQNCCDMLAKAEDGTYALILMDVQMPVMNGYDATAKIRGMADPKKSGITIIAMTANAFSEDRNTALKAGMNDHVAKPIDMKVLLATMLRYM